MLTGSPAHLTPGNSPNAQRVAPELLVRDEWGEWMIGVLKRQRTVVVELGFEMWQQKNLCFPYTPITYLRLDCGKDCLFEFQLGFTIVPPHPSIKDDLARMLQLWVGYSPWRLPDRARRQIEETSHAYVSRVSTRRPRSTRRRPSPGSRSLRYPMGR